MAIEVKEVEAENKADIETIQEIKPETVLQRLRGFLTSKTAVNLIMVGSVLTGAAVGLRYISQQSLFLENPIGHGLAWLAIGGVCGAITGYASTTALESTRHKTSIS